MLVALAVFAILGLMSSQLVTRILKVHDVAVTRGERLADVQRAMDVLQRDMLEYADRSVRDELGDELPPMRVTPDVPLELTRLGWRNPLDLPRSSAMRVAYALQDGKLLRYQWGMLDRAPDAQPLKQTLLADVDRFVAVVIDASGNEHTFWPLAGDAGLDPAARIAGVKISLEAKPFGEIIRVWDVPQPYGATPPA